MYEVDTVFYHLKYQNDTLPKYWLNYIEAFLTKNTLAETKSHINIITSMYTIQSTRKFITLAKTVLSFKHFTQDKCHWCKSKSLIVHIITGELYLSTSTSIQIGYRLFFNVDKMLTLNLTFLALKFYFEFNHCNTTGISISG